MSEPATKLDAADMDAATQDATEEAAAVAVLPVERFTGNIGPVAGIIKTPGIDDQLELLEAEEDTIATNRELLEGAQQSRAELERWRVLYQATLEQCNRLLMPRNVVLAGVAPNPNGLGAVFFGVDRDQREYTVTLTLPARERADFERASKEDFVRWAIDTVVGAVVEQRDNYLRRAGLH